MPVYGFISASKGNLTSATEVSVSEEELVLDETMPMLEGVYKCSSSPVCYLSPQRLI